MKAAVELADQALNVNKPQDEDYVLHGKSNLIRFNELDNVRRVNLNVSDIESDDSNFLPPNVFTPNGDGVNDNLDANSLDPGRETDGGA